MNARLAAPLRREQQASRFIPYTAQVSPNVVCTSGGDYILTLRLGGISFETADDVQLAALHERLNVLWRNIASPQVALWTHLIRRRETVPVAPVTGGFAGGLLHRYTLRLAAERLMVNELYLTLVYRPAAGTPATLWSRLFLRGSRTATELRDALDACEKLLQTMRAGLAHYEPEVLGVEHRGGRCYSRLLEFLALLLNGESVPMPLPRAPLHEVLATTRALIGGDVIEYRLPVGTRVAAVLGIKEYPTPTAVGMYDRLLSAPFAFVLTQSFAFLSKPVAQGLLQRQFNRMANAGDFAVSQAMELKDALDALTSNDFVMGDHHFALQVIAEVDADAQAGGRGLKPLNDAVALARSLLADTGMTVAREDLGLEAAYWAQLPAHFGLRLRKAPITSRNFCAMAAFHDYPAGRAAGNHWGEALATLITSAGSPYHFSLHASDPADPEGGSRKDTGHTFICGPTGSGKTVLIGFLIAMLVRQGATQVVFDKDRGLEILVRALGGDYLPLANGVPTGCNPLQLPRTADHEEFLRTWLRALARSPSRALTTREQADLDQALHGTLALECRVRRLSRLVEFLDRTDPEGVYARLARWCECTGGDYAWVFDNAEDVVAGRLAASTIIGFDVTDFLGHDIVRPVLTLYLFHLVRSLLDGRRFVCWMDEFWRLLSDPAFEGFAKDGPKTWRKLNAVMCLATQSASDVLHSPISRTIVEQTPTKILFPSVDAMESEYVDGLGLTQREFGLVRELAPGSRRFLVRQGHHSVVCQLDLRGFERELAVISGRADSVQRLHRLLERYGPDPGLWLPHFMGGDGMRPPGEAHPAG
ncbi:MAG TPA: VirB4 family type IV secretion/conjugal transfer ATPase [Steroidobacteraceae bacterium]|nr:VirB4 family type IV secretion/conjugal transfer ATPase [Steroidobacteraceae bacterium]